MGYTNVSNKVIDIALSIIIALTLLADMATDLGTASDCIEAANTTYPLTSLLKKKGIIYIILIVGIFTLIARKAGSGK